MIKKAITLGLLLCLIIESQAQITITKSDMPAVGDTIRFTTVNPTSLNFDRNATGSDYSWDFTGLKSLNEGLHEYQSALTTPYIFSFFGAMGQKIADTLGFGPLAAEKVYAFYASRNDAFVQRGYGFSMKLPGSPAALPLKGEYTDEDEIYEFPLTFEDSSTNTFNLKIPIGTFPLVLGNFYRTGTRTTVVDGYGTISTPYAKDVNCLRIKSTYQSRDSIAITTPSLNIGIPTTTIEYKWLSNTEKIPMLEITGSEQGGFFVPTLVRYRGVEQKPSSLADLLNKETLIYPNPTSGNLTIQRNSIQPTQAKLLNSLGQQLMEFELGRKSSIELSSFEKGIYFLILDQQTHKITIE